MSNQELKQYIKDSLSSGNSRQEIEKVLLNSGWDQDNINKAFEEVDDADEKVMENKNKTVISVSFFDWLRKQVSSWQEFNIINPNQAKQIMGQYQVKGVEERKDEVQKKTIRYILIAGTVLIGAGIFSFIAANWQTISSFIKVTIIIVIMLACYIGGWLLREKFGYRKTGEALILLGCIIYGSGIFLIAQIFHIRANWPDGFILWMLGALALAFVIDSLVLFILAIPLGIIALVGFPAEMFDQIVRSVLVVDRFSLTSSILLLVATIVTLFSGWVIRKKVKLD